jgi:hypothetical protein
VGACADDTKAVSTVYELFNALGVSYHFIPPGSAFKNMINYHILECGATMI